MVGLDNGITSRGQFYFYFYDLVFCSVYSVASIQWLFNGLKSWHIYKYVDKQLSLLPDTQAWNISIGSKYVIGHNEGTFIYKIYLIR
jgi:hypothetical protein